MTTTTPVTQRALPAAVWVLLAGEFLAIFDISVVNVILPTLQADLHMGHESALLVVAAYGLSYGSLLVVGGRLGDSFGFRRLFLLGVTIFGIASLLCGLAPNGGLLIAARAAQGVGAAMLFPQVLAGIQQIVAPAARGRAVGIFGAILGFGSTMGQLGGGVLAEWNLASAGWRTVFLVNIPLCLIVVLAGRRTLPSTSGVKRDFDPVGAVLLAGTLAALVICVQQGVLFALAVAILGTAFVWWERRVQRSGRTPLLDFDLLRHPAFVTGLVMCLTFFGTQVPFYVMLSETAQVGSGLQPLAAAELYAGLGVAFLIVSVIAGRLDARYGARLITTGGALMAASFLGLLLVPLSDLRPGFTAATGLLILNGLGAGMVAPTVIRYVLAGIAPESAGLAAGLLSTAQQTANSVGVVAAGAVLALGADLHDGFRLVLFQFLALIAVTVVLAQVSSWLRRRDG